MFIVMKRHGSINLRTFYVYCLLSYQTLACACHRFGYIYTVHTCVFCTTSFKACLTVIQNPKWAFVQLNYEMISEWEHLHLLITFQMNYSNDQDSVPANSFTLVQALTAADEILCSSVD